VYDDPINEDLLLHYKLDADLRDETSNQFGLQHYTFSGSAETPSNPNFSSDALSGQSIYFDGNISKNALRGDNLRSNLLNGLTYIAWVKIPQNAIADGSKRGIVAQGLTPYLIKNKSGNLEARLDFMKPDNTEIKISIISAAVLPADQWAQVALTWYPANSTSEKNIALYIDGSKIDETNSPYVFLKPDSRLAIGKVSKSMYFFNGMIDEVKIYSTALTETQIQAEYQSQVD